jgi:hypothetical protein
MFNRSDLLAVPGIGSRRAMIDSAGMTAAWDSDYLD